MDTMQASYDTANEGVDTEGTEGRETLCTSSRSCEDGRNEPRDVVRLYMRTYNIPGILQQSFYLCIGELTRIGDEQELDENRPRFC